MCKNAQATAVSLMAAIEPTITSLLTLEGVANTPQATAALAAFESAMKSISAWKSGTPAQDALQALGALQEALNALNTLIPSNALTLLNIIFAGIETVIGVLSANSPAPSTTDTSATVEDIQAAHQAEVAVSTAAKVETLVPGFKRSIFHSPESQYKSAWDKAIDEGKFPESMKVF